MASLMMQSSYTCAMLLAEQMNAQISSLVCGVLDPRKLLPSLKQGLGDHSIPKHLLIGW